MLKTLHHLWLHSYPHSLHSLHQISLLVLPLTYNAHLLPCHLFQLYCPIPNPYRLPSGLMQKPPPWLLYFLSHTLRVYFVHIPQKLIALTLKSNILICWVRPIIIFFNLAPTYLSNSPYFTHFAPAISIFLFLKHTKPLCPHSRPLHL